jgi:signal transduction histidine kinase
VRPRLLRLFGDHRRRLRELRGLHEISQAFAAMSDIQETYGRLTRRIAELIGARKCVISVYDRRTREMVGQAPGFGVSDGIIRAFRHHIDTLRRAWDFRVGGPMVKNRPEDFHPALVEYLRPFELHNLAVVPLILESRIIGMVSMGNKPGGFSRDDVRLLTVFAAQAAVAIQNARLYTHLEESRAQLEVKVRERTAELEATYRELAASHERLRELDQLKSDFLGNVSHELRTPLAAIKGFVDNLLDGVGGPLADRPRHYLVRVRANTDRLSRMVSDLLDLTRIEAGKIELSPARVAVPDAVADVIETFRPVAQLREIELAADLGVCASIWADRDKVQQILGNLVANAIKFSPPGGRVTVRAAGEQPGTVRLEVRDTGPGIPPEERERVFDRFYQGRRLAEERPGGTGLGLTIARHLVELHGGRIWVDPGSGGGSVFVVLLPAAPPVGPAAGR